MGSTKPSSRYRPSPPRSDLRIADLMQRTPTATRLLNVKIPVKVIAAVERVAAELHTSKTEVLVALLFEGLAVATRRLGKGAAGSQSVSKA